MRGSEKGIAKRRPSRGRIVFEQAEEETQFEIVFEPDVTLEEKDDN